MGQFGLIIYLYFCSFFFLSTFSCLHFVAILIPFSLYRKLFFYRIRSLLNFIHFSLHCTVGFNKQTYFPSFISLFIVLFPLKNQRGTSNILHSFSFISMFLTFFLYLFIICLAEILFLHFSVFPVTVRWRHLLFLFFSFIFNVNKNDFIAENDWKHYGSLPNRVPPRNTMLFARVWDLTQSSEREICVYFQVFAVTKSRFIKQNDFVPDIILPLL